MGQKCFTDVYVAVKDAFDDLKMNQGCVVHVVSTCTHTCKGLLLFMALQKE